MPRVFAMPNLPNVLRKTDLFGVYKKDARGNAQMPRVLPSQAREQGATYYYPDIVNDLQITDHFPIIQDVVLNGEIKKVLTLNCMKQCTYNASYQSHNNAFNKVESDEQYQYRLSLLAEIVVTMIKENPESVTFSLQEAPFYESREGRMFFDIIYQKTGWRYVHDDVSSMHGGLVTLYKPEELSYDKNKIKSSKIGARYQTIPFTVNGSNQPLTLINMHGLLDNSKENAKLISTSQTTRDLIVTGDSNIPSSAQSIDALGNIAAHKAAKHHQALEKLSRPIFGNYTVIQGTTDKSKNGVDTLDVIAISPNLSPLNVRKRMLPNLDANVLMSSRIEVEHSTAAIREDMRAVCSPIEAIAHTQPGPTRQASPTRQARPARPEARLSPVSHQAVPSNDLTTASHPANIASASNLTLFKKNPYTTFESVFNGRIKGSTSMKCEKVVSFASQADADKFLAEFKKLYPSINKKTRPDGNTQRVTIILTDQQIKIALLKILKMRLNNHKNKISNELSWGQGIATYLGFFQPQFTKKQEIDAIDNWLQLFDGETTGFDLKHCGVSKVGTLGSILNDFAVNVDLMQMSTSDVAEPTYRFS